MKDLAEGEYRALARLRYVLRRLLRSSEQEARHLGLTPAQHQLLLAIRGLGRDAAPSISELAERLQQRHHSVVELVGRVEAGGLVIREPDPSDRRRHLVRLTTAGNAVLAALSGAHRSELRRFRQEMADIFERLG